MVLLGIGVGEGVDKGVDKGVDGGVLLLEAELELLGGTALTLELLALEPLPKMPF